MKLNRISNVNFYGNIIDSHSHIGHWNENGKLQNYTNNDIDVFTKTPLKNGDVIEKIIVSNLDCMVHKNNENSSIEFLADEIVGNKKMLELSKNNSKIAPLATCQPGYGTVENIKTLFQDNPDKFVGLKFHPEQLNLPVSDSKYQDYMDFAAEKKIPCLFHSARTYDMHYPDGGVGKASRLSNPEQIYELARKNKDVPIIMAHWGGDGEKNIDTTTKCIIDSIKNKDAALYADISWVDCDNSQKPNLKRIIEQLKAEDGLDRIVFGTDAPLGCFGSSQNNGVAKQTYENTVVDIKNMIKREFKQDSENIIDKIFYQNAKKLFLEKKSAEPSVTTSGVNTSVRSSSKYLGFAIAGTVLSAGLAIGAYYKKAKAHENDEMKPLDLRA